ncbi:MAG TPA: FAD-dependent oxidoreductase [Vicinamibacteria bacterium]|nr:FAD-dependent oxidoreductase [Vicinamibacteria bacterium]
MRLVVIGAGPIGLEAALGAAERGFDVTVLEKERVGASLHRWGSVRLFSPFAMNASARAQAALGRACPPGDALLTGPEMVEHVLEPLARRPALAGRVRTGHRVLAVGRARTIRRDLPGHPLRGERPFRLLVETPEGEHLLEADAVLDASGVYGRPAALGAGGIPAPGERALDGQIIRHLGALESALPRLAGRDVLLVGHGHSAANALALLASAEPRPRVTWAVRSPNRRPCVEVAEDPLPERQRVTAAANDLAAEPPSFLRVERRAAVECVRLQDGRLAVSLGGGRGGVFDAVAALTGYRPDLSFLGELALEISPASEGPARLARALSNVTDCLTPPAVAPRDLDSGEPGFHMVGAKSYGRLPTFLLRAGLGQLETILDSLAARP